MPGRDRDILSLQLASHVHQATEIAGQQRFRTRRSDIRGLLFDNRVRDIGILYAKCTAKAAADIWVLHLG